MRYASYKDYMVTYDEENYTLAMIHTSTKSTVSLVVEGLYEAGEKVFGMEEYDTVRVQNINADTHRHLAIMFTTEKHMPKAELHVYVDPKGITLAVYEIGHYTLRTKGYIVHGESKDCIAINARNTPTEVLRGAIGPAVSVRDNAIYNKLTDSALVINGCDELELYYDWSEEKYGAVVQTITEGRAEQIRFSVQTDLLRDKFNIEFAPRKDRGIYKTPPAGWMTWYAVKFEGGEEAVLRNTRFQAEYLKDFGADTVWVDWEWCHQRYERERFDGVNHFRPDPKKYPHGLGYVAAEIKKAGFVPALWIGYTNDISLTEYEKKHPEVSLSHQETWCGQYYYDMSQPEYLDGFLPEAIRQVKDWGYEAIKYDTLYDGIEAHERYHANMYNPELTTYKAYRGMIQKTRELLGEECYMLSCGGSEEVAIWGSGVFDAVRVGPDLFEWAGFLTNLDRVRRYYPMHSIVQYNDLDNVVLREEFSTYAQAVSRVALVSLLGLPLTFGDNLPDLPADRVDLLKRTLPTMNVHPVEFNNAVSDGTTQLITLNIALPFEQYLVAGVMNLTEEGCERKIDFKETLGLSEGEYLVYDYFKQEFLGIHEGSITVKVEPYDTPILCFRKKLDRPQIISTSRHITQGAAEIKETCWDDSTNTLCMVSSLVKGDPYIVTVYVPTDFKLKECSQGEYSLKGNVLKIVILPKDNKEYAIQLSFEK